MKLAFATLLLVSLVLGSSFLQFVIAEPPTASPASAPTTDLPIIGFCNTKCAVRCAKAGEMKRCLKYCGMCCQECKCVPSGTYGNKSECPCYRDKLNSKDEPKCP